MHIHHIYTLKGQPQLDYVKCFKLLVFGPFRLILLFGRLRDARSSQGRYCTTPFTIYCCNNQLTADRFPVLSWSGAVVCVNYSSSNNGTILGRTIVIGRTVVHTYDRPLPRKYRKTIGSELVVTAVCGEGGGAVTFLRTAYRSMGVQRAHLPPSRPVSFVETSYILFCQS